LGDFRARDLKRSSGALFAAIGTSKFEKASSSFLNLGKKHIRLSCSINYDANNGSASRGRGKGKVASGFI
jgi:hypothetical protein